MFLQLRLAVHIWRLQLRRKCLGGVPFTVAKPGRSVQTRIESADPKAEPSLQPLVILHGVDLISHLWQQYVNVALLPLASTSVTVRREMVVFNNQTISRIEGAVNHVLQRMIDSEHRVFHYMRLL